MNITQRIRCAVCSAFASFCKCDPTNPCYCTTTDAAPKPPTCPDKVEDKAAPKETIRQKFERFCDDNPEHHDCRIYD